MLRYEIEKKSQNRGNSVLRDEIEKKINLKRRQNKNLSLPELVYQNHDLNRETGIIQSKENEEKSQKSIPK